MMWQCGKTLLIVDKNFGGSLIMYILESFHYLKFGKESISYNIL